MREKKSKRFIIKAYIHKRRGRWFIFHYVKREKFLFPPFIAVVETYIHVRASPFPGVSNIKALLLFQGHRILRLFCFSFSWLFRGVALIYNKLYVGNAHVCSDSQTEDVTLVINRILKKNMYKATNLHAASQKLQSKKITRLLLISYHAQVPVHLRCHPRLQRA